MTEQEKNKFEVGGLYIIAHKLFEDAKGNERRIRTICITKNKDRKFGEATVILIRTHYYAASLVALKALEIALEGDFKMKLEDLCKAIQEFL